jgi:hypothetical protein
MTLTYGSRGFATRAQQLIAMKTPFTIVVGDPAAHELAGNIEDGHLILPARLTANQHLRALVGVVMLAATSGGTYQISHVGPEFVVTVFWGSGQAPVLEA